MLRLKVYIFLLSTLNWRMTELMKEEIIHFRFKKLQGIAVGPYQFSGLCCVSYGYRRPSQGPFRKYLSAHASVYMQKGPYLLNWIISLWVTVDIQTCWSLKLPNESCLLSEWSLVQIYSYFKTNCIIYNSFVLLEHFLAQRKGTSEEAAMLDASH